eukprot:7945933-Pyramimonas_sp.AAC.2
MATGPVHGVQHPMMPAYPATDVGSVKPYRSVLPPVGSVPATCSSIIPHERLLAGPTGSPLRSIR